MSTFFLEYQDTTDMKINDFVIQPFELDIEAEISFTKTENPKEFPIINGKFKNSKLYFNKCQFV